MANCCGVSPQQLSSNLQLKFTRTAVLKSSINQKDKRGFVFVQKYKDRWQDYVDHEITFCQKQISMHVFTCTKNW